MIPPTPADSPGRFMTQETLKNATDVCLAVYQQEQDPERIVAKAAREYLRLIDPTPITAEWLQGFAKVFGCGYFLEDAASDRRLVLLIDHRGRWSVDLVQGDETTDLGEVKSRGQLRALCLGLKIELKEKN